MHEQSIIVIGGGIAGLTAGALLAHAGFKVTLLEAHMQPGGCAGTFRRGPYVFDVGATQVAGFEKGGVHERIFRHLNWPLPAAEILDPACTVHLGDGSKPISLWHDPEKWEKERNAQFPGSERFWSLCNQLHQSNWSFASSDPVLPIQNLWDLRQCIKASKPINFLSGIFSTSSVADLLWLCSCHQDQRLRTFLDLQLKLYSQELTSQTSALYGATVLQMAQAPLGLWHLQGSMQKLSDSLLSCFLRDGGKFLSGHKVVGLESINCDNSWKVDVLKNKHISLQFDASDVVFTPPPQCLLHLIRHNIKLPTYYRHKLEKLSEPSGAIVFYGAIDRRELPLDCSSHVQVIAGELGSLFISISHDGDGRAPLGKATVIASAFTDPMHWFAISDCEYKKNKESLLNTIVDVLNNQLGIDSKNWLNKELATPQSFERWTGRPNGIVGGLGQKPLTFGPFGLPSRTPLKGLWLCGDSIYPGEGTAGVSQSAMMACRQLMSEHNIEFLLTR